MNEIRNDLEKFFEFLKSHKISLAIYGTGEAGRLIWDSVTNHLGYKIENFFDRNPGGFCCGLPVKDICSIKKKTGIIIAADPSYEIEKRFEKNEKIDWIYMDPVFLNYYCRSDDYINNNKKMMSLATDEIAQVKQLLGDEMSLKIYDEMLSQRINPLLENIKEFYDKEQYFGNDIIPTVTGTVLDCGAYTGDTLSRFLLQIEDNNWKYYAFEGDPSNCQQIKSLAKEKNVPDHVKVYNVAVWNEETELIFDNPTGTHEMTSGRVSEEKENGIKVKASRLDSVLLDADEIIDRIDLITMDIEGAEINALMGAKGIITRFHPQMAISVYHETDHLWRIPLLIHEMNPNYKIFLRHHRWNIADTVCYAI